MRDVLTLETELQLQAPAALLRVNAEQKEGKGKVHPRTGHEGPEGE